MPALRCATLFVTRVINNNMDKERTKINFANCNDCNDEPWIAYGCVITISITLESHSCKSSSWLENNDYHERF